MSRISIGGVQIGEDSKTFFIAELSANHNQNFDLAIRTIEAIAKTGADAVKLQTYTPDTITINCKNDYFKIKQNSVWDGQYLYDLYRSAYTPWEWQPKLKEFAESLGLICFSSPFDTSAVDFLEEIDVPAYKVASFEITDTPLIKYIAGKGKPVIISTGIATKEDIEKAIEACRSMGNEQIVLLKCTSGYPSPLKDLNLSLIPDLKQKYNVEVGLSDHTMGNIVPIASVALGASVIEKHVILDRKLGGPDSSFSLEPNEFKEMVEQIRLLEDALGKSSYELTERMVKSREHARSLFVVEDIKKGQLFSKENVRSIRPGYGIHPEMIVDILGKKAREDIKKGTPMLMEYVEDVGLL